MIPSTFLILLIIFMGAVLQTTAHMTMSDPPPLRYKTNPYKTVEDYDYSAPLSPSGSNYPCKGYHKDMGTPSGKSVATYAPGGKYSIKLAGSATHGGGSCQISMSFDKGSSFQVVRSFIGGCANPDPSGDQSFDFTMPKDVPNGDALLAWTWFNEQGNREMYMNCAVVTIGTSRKKLARSVLHPRASRPALFVANIGNGCTTAGGTDVIFPSPGGDIAYGISTKTAAPVGNCGPSSGGGNSGGTTSGGGQEATPDGEHDCAYWRAQGYICSAGIGLREILPSLWWLLFVLFFQVFGI